MRTEQEIREAADMYYEEAQHIVAVCDGDKSVLEGNEEARRQFLVSAAI